MTSVEIKKDKTPVQVGALRFAKSLQGKLGTSRNDDVGGDQEETNTSRGAEI